MSRAGVPTATKELGEALRELKERTPHSYDTLATRLGISRSTLHRYCQGKLVPTEFAVVEGLATHANAGHGELRLLHRLWVLARERALPDETVQSVVESYSVIAEHSDGAEEDHDEKDTFAVTTRIRRSWALITVCMSAALVASSMLWLENGETGRLVMAPGGRSALLFNEPCSEPITAGQYDECVREVQHRLEAIGVDLTVDGMFGDETMRRVVVFQEMNGLEADGVVDEDTKEALYAGETDLTTWDEDTVEEKIREVFTERPDTAVRIADCQSHLDPLHVLNNNDLSRNWGVFQLSDYRLRELRSTPREALDPEWNIQAAYEIWSRDQAFDEWPHCSAAVDENHAGDPN